MVIQFILAILFAIAASGEKMDGSNPAMELLTQKPWILASHGCDENANGLIDTFEEMISECEKDNQYSFHLDGHGLYEDNSLVCGNGITEWSFEWSVANNGTRLNFLFCSAEIARLDSGQLIIYSNIQNAGHRTLRFIQVFKH